MVGIIKIFKVHFLSDRVGNWRMYSKKLALVAGCKM